MVYVYLSLTVTDPDTFATYREVAGDAMTKHSCKVVSVGRDNVALDGDVAAPGVGVILSFDSSEDAQNWMNDPEIETIHELRRKSGDVSIILLQ